jgi:hypothetical protein
MLELKTKFKIFLVSIFLVIGLVIGNAWAQVEEILDENCVGTVLNQNFQVGLGGGFGIVAPTPNGFYRVRFLCKRPDGDVTAESELIQGEPFIIVEVGGIVFGPGVPIPVALQVDAPATVLTPAAPTVQLTTTGILANESTVDVTAPTTGTFYSSTNSAIATVSPEGLVTGLSSGRVFINALHEGVLGGVAIDVVFSADTDNDGMPDDFEMANSINPGGVNVSLLTGAAATGHAEEVGSESANAIDGNATTVWRAPAGGSPSFFEVVLAEDTNVVQVRMVGDPAHANGAVEFSRGVFQAFDALNNELFNSGDIQLSGSDPTVVVALNAPSARRIRFTSTGTESAQPSLAEFQIISGAGDEDSGLDLNDPLDAENIPLDLQSDLDSDGLSNLDEFTLGTSIFNADTDGDGLTDPEEGVLGSNPLLADSDNDGLTDQEEQILGTDVNLADTDGDGLSDGLEVLIDLNPLSTDSDNDLNPDGAEDTDGDGIVNFDEVAGNTDPGKADTDGDGIDDLEEITVGADGFITDPRKRDTDGDRLPDNFEIAFNRDPTTPEVIGPDGDQDGIPDSFETANAVSPGDGSNLSLLKDATLSVSSFLTGFPSSLAVDEDLNTSWFTNTGDAANQGSQPFITLTLPSVLNVSKLRLFGNRTTPDGSDFLQGTIQGFDKNGIEVFNSGPVDLPAPDRDVVVAIGGLELSEVKFTSTLDEGASPGLSEFEVLADVSGLGLDLNLFADAELDFDGDGFSNLIEFYFGSNIFLIDTDGDGLTDSIEFELGFSPILRDTDGDGIEDGDEVVNENDSDGDGLPDDYEIEFGLDPNNPNDAALDSDNDGISNLDEFLAGTDPTNPDTISPTVFMVTPFNGATDVVVNHRVVVRFAEPLQPESIVGGVVRMTETVGGAEVAGAIILSNDKLSVTFNPQALLTTFTSYTVDVQNVRDVAGNLMGSPFQSAFTTGDGTDSTAPSILKNNLVNNPFEEPTVPINTPIIITFDEPMDPASVTMLSFSVRDGDFNALIPGMVQVDGDGLRASFIADPNFPRGSRVFGGGGGGIFINISDIRDLAGNPLSQPLITQFSTEVFEDTASPVLANNFPVDGQTDVPLNAALIINFNEPMSRLNVFADEIKLETNGQEVPGSFAMSFFNEEVTFTPTAPLTANTLYTATVSGNLHDIAGNFLLAGTTFSFQTGITSLGSQTNVTFLEPADGSVNIPTNARVIVQFNQPIIAATLEGNDFQSGGPANVVVSPDNLSATFTPANDFLPFSNPRFFLNAIKDQAGRPVSIGAFFSRFTVGAGPDTTSPEVELLSIVDGTIDVPVNARINFKMDSLISIADESSLVVRLVDPITADVINGTVTFNSITGLWTFTPSVSLTPGTEYRLEIDGFTDLAGNSIAVTFTSGFTTSASPNPDTTSPTFVSISPAGGAVDVPVNSNIVLTADETIDSTSRDPIVSVDGLGTFAGNTLISGNVITFTPLAPFPGNSTVRVNAFGRDLAGNGRSAIFNFQTEAVQETGAPQVVEVTPQNDALDVFEGTDVVMVFSESMDPSTLSKLNFGLFANGEELDTTFSRSTDNRVVTLHPFSGFSTIDFPLSSLITVVATDKLKDFSGNALPHFQSQFTTQSGSQPTSINFKTARPGFGASGVSVNAKIYLMLGNPLDPLLIDDFIVTEGNVVKSGTASLELDGRMLVFTPDTPFGFNQLIEGFAAPPLDDFFPTSRPVMFQTEEDTTITSPSAIDFIPLSSAVDVPVNPVIEVRFSEPLDPATVNAGTVNLTDSIGTPVAATISLVRQGRMVRIVPDAVLSPSTLYSFEVTMGVLDLQGNPADAAFSSSFTTGTVSDNIMPEAVKLSPPNGSTDVGIDVPFKYRFDEPINPLSVTGQTILITDGNDVVVPCTINFVSDPNGTQDVIISPQAPLTPLSIYTVTVDGVEDLSGNLMVPRALQFTTGTGVDVTFPRGVQVTPSEGSVDVPVNAMIRIESLEPLDFRTVVETGMFTQSIQLVVGPFFNTRIAGFTSLSPDGKVLTFTPDAPLPPNSSLRARVSTNTSNRVRDLSGNPLLGPTGSAFGFQVDFTTSTVTDTTPPILVGISPSDGLVDVPINPLIEVQFDEPIYVNDINGVSLERFDGLAVATKMTLVDGGTTVTLRPLDLIEPNTLYRVKIDSSVTDSAGNAIPLMIETTFTTGAQADPSHPEIVSTTPLDGATGVATNTTIVINFDDAINLLSVASSLRLSLTTNSAPIPGTFSFSADQKTVIFTPDNVLNGSTIYRMDNFNIRDLAGNNLIVGGTKFLEFTTGP